MAHNSLTAFLRSPPPVAKKGPVAIIFVEDDVEISTTVRHHVQSGFGAVLVMDFVPISGQFDY